MFLRIFRYRVQPQMRDRHLAVQARSAQLYGKYVSKTPTYFRRSGDANNWVELHWYVDKAECQRVAQAVADDLELARLWREFQETLDADYPPILEEYGEYELPRPVSASPFSQPPIDAEPQPAPKPPAAAPVAEVVRPVEHATLKPTSDNGDGRTHEHANANGSAVEAEVVAAADEPSTANDHTATDEPAQRPLWPSPPLPVDNDRDELVIEDDPPSETRSSSLSYNDGVWIVEPEDKPAPRGENH